MKRHGLLSFATVALGVAASRGLAQTAIPDSLTRRIDGVFARYTASTPGCALGVYQNGKISYAKGYGLASVEFAAPITPRAAADTLRAVDHQTLRGAGITIRFVRPTADGAATNFTLDNGRARGLEFSRAAR